MLGRKRRRVNDISDHSVVCFNSLPSGRTEKVRSR